MIRVLCLILILLAACTSGDKKETNSNIRLVTLDPGHFHAALVQKSMLPGVDTTVYVYAPDGPDAEAHLKRIRGYNSRGENPTHWNEQYYMGPDYLERMLRDKPGNVVVISGNNQKKTDYILKSMGAGLNVLADKPMTISSNNFELLKAAFTEADRRKTLLYDIMTERYEITNILQREFSMTPEIFGTLQQGSEDVPSVTKESVHHFFKYVSGQVLVRPAWFLDVEQQGEGLTDITTHLVDLVQWECFPEKTLDYEKDIEVLRARRSSTEITKTQFSAITRMTDFPDYLKKDLVRDTVLRVFSNGEILYRIKGVVAKVSVKWAYQAPEGTGDTHYSIMRGTLSNLIIRQGAEQQFKPTLYIESVKPRDAVFSVAVAAAFKNIESRYPGITLKENDKGWEVVIPDRYKEGHEAHFAMVTEKYLKYLREGNMPAWEVPNMLAKYYTTTTALQMARRESVRK